MTGNTVVSAVELPACVKSLDLTDFKGELAKRAIKKEFKDGNSVRILVVINIL